MRIFSFAHEAPPGGERSRWSQGGARLLVAALAVFLSTFTTLQAQQPTGTVTGRVTDAASGQALPETQVSLTGTGLGALTNQSGRYIILNVPVGQYEIRAERIGHGVETQSVTVQAGQAAQADFQLEIEALGLDEVVVTGTAGAARRREVGNTITQVNMTEVQEAPVNVDAILQTRVPGMTLNEGSGMAGAGARIRLRGNVSVAQSNQPIIYVDGVRIRSDAYHKNVPPVGYPGRSSNTVPSPLNDINPQDIERIEVIKGAAATTLYGTEAASGVIQIFTKRGHRGEARWTAQIDQGVAWSQTFGPDPSDRPPSEPEILDSGATSDYLFINPWLRGSLPDCDDVDNQPCDSGLFSDWGAHQQKYALSVSGGGQELQYFLSGTYQDDKGVLPNDALEKYVVRGNFTFTPLPTVTMRWNSSYNNTDIANTAAGNNAHGLTLNSFRRDANYLGDEAFDAINPFLGQDIETRIDHFITALTTDWAPLTNLTNRLSVGWDQAHQDNRNYRPFGFIRAPLGIISDGRSKFSTLTLDYVGTLDFPLNDELRSSFSWGGQSITTWVEETVGYGEDFPVPSEATVTSAATTLGFEIREKVVNAGFFFQNMFDLRDKYFLTAGVRVDGNSAFGEDFGLQAYPKVSASWVASDEEFWPENLGSMKVRGAWGQSGRAPGAFDAVRTWDAVGWGPNTAVFPRNLGNAELGPERTSEIELGFDAAFLDDRLAMDFTYYNQNTTDALFNVRQIPSEGFLGSQLENVGEIKNSGIEFALSGTVMRRTNFSWDLGTSIFTNSSEVSLPDEVPEFAVADNAWVIDGEDVPVVRANCVANPNETGLLNTDFVEDGGDIQRDCLIGPNQPTHVIGGFTTLSFPHGITLSARGEYQGGHYMYDGAAWNAVRRSVTWPGCYDAYRVQETQGVQAMTKLQQARCIVDNSDDDYFIYPADFFKLRSVSLQVPIPDRFMPWGEGATFTLSGKNLWRWVDRDEFPVFEPEMTNNNDNNPISRDGAVGGDFLVNTIFEHVPPTSVFTASLRVNF